MCGIYSTRKLELACRRNIDFIWLLQGEKVPGYLSFARFRRGKAKEVFNEYSGKGNLTRKKLRELADKQLPPNAEFVHGVGKRKSEWQKLP